MSEDYRILVAGVGNVLRQDDSFGVAVANRLSAHLSLPESLKVIETGIGGISLVQELLDRYDMLLVVDAVQRDGPPGQVYVLEAGVPDLDDLAEPVRCDLLADMHFSPTHRGC